MENKLAKLTLVATLVLSLALTFSCGGNDSGDLVSSSGTTPSSSSAVPPLHSSSSLPSSSSVLPPSSSSGSDVYGTPVTYEGETYKTVKIGEQVWMAKNLNYAVEGSRCYDDSEANCTIYGRLYSWATAMDIDTKYNNEEWGGSDVKHQGICPDGWHLPSKAEWNALFLYAGDESNKLKSVSGWIDPHNGSSISGTDEYGFSALPGGRYGNGSFILVGSYGHWWISTEYDSESVLVRYMGWYGDIADQRVTLFIKSYLHSVRCLQD